MDTIKQLMARAAALALFHEREQWLLKGEQLFLNCRKHATGERDAQTGKLLVKGVAQKVAWYAQEYESGAKLLAAEWAKLQADQAQVGEARKLMVKMLAYPDVAKQFKLAEDQLAQRQANYEAASKINDDYRTHLRYYEKVVKQRTANGFFARRTYPTTLIPYEACREWIHCDENVARRLRIKEELRDQWLAAVANTYGWHMTLGLQRVHELVSAEQADQEWAQVVLEFERLADLTQQINAILAVRNAADNAAQAQWENTLLVCDEFLALAGDVIAAATAVQAQEAAAAAAAAAELAKQEAAAAQQKQIQLTIEQFAVAMSRGEVAQLSDKLEMLGVDRKVVKGYAKPAFERLAKPVAVKVEQMPEEPTVKKVNRKARRGQLIESMDDLEALSDDNLANVKAVLASVDYSKLV